MSIRNRVKEMRMVPACDLKKNPGNWRTHPKAQQDALRGLLAEVGFAGAELCRELPDGSLMLIDGHCRAEIMGTNEVPCLILDVSEAEADKLLATFDPIGAMAGADRDKLDSLLREVQTESQDVAKMLEELGKQAGCEWAKEQQAIVEDEVPEPPVVPITQPGDLWVMGEHRLLCGDSTKAEDVGRLMAGQTAMLMSTDPPYGVDFAGAKYNPRAKEWAGIANDELQGTDLEAFVVAMLKAWLPFVSKQAGFYFWTVAMQEGAAAAAAVRAVGLHIQSQIIWNKNALVLGQADYHWKHENCWYAFWKGEKHRWLGERTKTTVWEVSKVAHSSYVHPMQKPVELYAIPMQHHTYEGEVVVEPFSGSGSQLIAAEQLSRRCYAMEISPLYCDVAVARWEKLTGKKATRQPKV